MVLCVNTSLKMGKGKIAAQCCHAAMGVIEELLAEDPALWEHYQSCGQPKIALQVKDPAEMHRLAKHAQGLGVLNYIVRDAGRTQIPAGSQTVVAIGPAPKSLIDQVTGHLKLL